MKLFQEIEFVENTGACGPSYYNYRGGIEMRAIFSALAMHAELSAGYERAEWPTPMAGDLAKRSVQFADALIKELEETKK